MKKFFAIMLALCVALLPCLALGNAAEAPIHDIRYFFEHKLIPELFYQNPEALIQYMRDKGAFDLWGRFTKANNLDIFYSEADFEVRDLSQAGGLQMVMISLPKPPDSPLCFRIYLCCDPTANKAAVFTVEYEDLLGDSCFICGWSQEGSHQNYGGGSILDPNDAGYEAGLQKEAEFIRGLMRG